MPATRTNTPSQPEPAVTHSEPHPLTLAQNIALVQGLVRASGRLSVEDLLAAVGLEGRAGSRPRQLSGGETARAGLAVALANRPSVLLADEPTGELDEHSAGAILRLLRTQTESGTAVVVVSHGRRAMAEADRVVELRDGQVVS